MTATQTQLRRGTAAQCAAMTPVVGEVIVDTTNDRLNLGDGSRPGGFQIPNFADLQGQNFIAAVATGTADAAEIDVTPRPTAYAAFQRFVWTASGDNTVTNPSLNVKGAAGSLLGAVQIKKKSSSGLSVLAPGDIQGGCIYSAVYTGTYFQLESVDIPPPSGVATLSVKTFSGVAECDFTGFISSAYAGYEWDVDVLPATDNVNLHMLTSANNGSTWDVTAGHYAYDNYGETIGTAGVGDTNASGSAAQMIPGSTFTIGNAADEGLQARISIINPLGTARKKVFEGTGNHLRTTGALKRWVFTGTRLSTAKIDAVRFKMSSGNITGTIRMRGIN